MVDSSAEEHGDVVLVEETHLSEFHLGGQSPPRDQFQVNLAFERGKVYQIERVAGLTLGVECLYLD